MSFYGSHSILFSELGLTFIKGINEDEPKSPHNGCGKSTIVDAIDWCLFGEHPRGDTAKSLINDEAKKDCWVCVFLEDNGSHYEIFRFRQLNKDNGVYFLLSSPKTPIQNLTCLDTSKTQEIINQHLGLDRSVYKAAIYRSQNDPFSFVAATDGERKELLSSIVPELQKIDEMKEKAKGKQTSLHISQVKLESSIQSIENELVTLKAIDWEKEKTDWYCLYKQRVSFIEDKKDLAVECIKQANYGLSFLQPLKDQLASLAHPLLQSQAKNCHNEWLKTVNTFNTNLVVLQSQYKALQAEYTTMSSGVLNTSKCPRCKQLINEQHVQEEIKLIQKEMDAVLVSGRIARDTLNSAKVQETIASQAMQVEDQENKQQLMKYSKAVGSLDEKIKSLEVLEKQHLPSLEKELKDYLDQVNKLDSETWPGLGKQFESEARIYTLEVKLDLIKTDILQIDKEMAVYDFWIDNAFSAKGLKNLIMDSRIEDMTLAANSWVQAITGGTTWLRFETQTTTQAGKLSEKLNIRIFRHNPDGTITERNFKSWSGGEKTRVALGADQGLSKLIGERATKSWDLLILDEAFSRGLDSGGREAVFEQIQKLKGTVLVIDHSDISNHFEDVMTVKIKNRRSEVFYKGKSCSTQVDYKSLLPKALEL